MGNDEDVEAEMVLGRVSRLVKEKLQSDDTEPSWIADFIDSRLNGDFNNLQARIMMRLSISCLEEDRDRRPTMENAVQILVLTEDVSGANVMVRAT